MRRLAPFCLPLALVACERTGVQNDGHIDTIEGKRISYIPEGCGYSVTTPDVEHAVRGKDDVGPNPAPDHIHLSWAGETHSTFAVNWRTDTATLVSRVLYGTDRAKVEAADEAGDGVFVQEGHSMRFISIWDSAGSDEDDGLRGTRVHEAHVCGLEPDRTYFYKVGGPGGWSDVKRASTAPEPGSTRPFRFAVAGDSRNQPDVLAAAQRAIRDTGAEFQLFSGDAVMLGLDQGQWDAFFEEKSDGVAVQDVLAEMPLMMANGNHDALAVNYVAQFAFPQDKSDGEGADGEEWYSFDYGNAHVVMLNDSTSTDETITVKQAKWLDDDLAKVDRNKTPWIFVVHHRPPYSCGATHGSDHLTRSAWQPIYDRYEVDMVFNGHVHNYERSKPIRGFQDGTNAGVVAQMGDRGAPVKSSGTVYVVAAGVGAPLYGAGNDCYHTQYTESVRNYVIVDIDGRTMRYTAYRLDGSVLDEFEYRK